LEDGESLGALVHGCGYSAPSKEDPCARANIVVRGVNAGSVEVERRGKEAYATLSIPDFHNVAGAVQSFLKDVHGVGLLK
jgi:hypothetical protein